MDLPASATPILLETYLKQLKLPAMGRHYPALAREATARNLSHLDFLTALCEQELRQREQNQLARRLRAAQFPWVKTLDTFDFAALPKLNKAKVLALAEGHFVRTRENCILQGNPGLGKTHLAIAIGRACCQQGCRVLFRTAATLVNDLAAAQQDHRLNRFLKQFRTYDLLIIDELGYLPFTPERAQLLFQFFTDRYERASVLLTTNLVFARWTEVFGDERLTAALLDRLTHRGQLFRLEGESYRFKESVQRHLDGGTTGA